MNQQPPTPPAENAPLYLLDGLEDAELDAYLLARRNDPVVRAAECEASETLADLVLSVPQIAPPDSCLEGIRTRIQSMSRPLPVRFYHRLRRISPGWAAAAALAIVAAWSTVKRMEAENELTQLKQQKQDFANHFLENTPGGTGDPDKLTAHTPPPGEDAALPGTQRDKRRPSHARGAGGHQLIQNHAELRARLNQLEQRNARRLQTRPGLHRPTIFEMQRPDETSSGDGSKLTLSSSRVGDILADALLAVHDPDKTNSGASGKQPFRIGNSNRDDEILIESGMRDLSVFHLPEEVHVRNLGLPVADAAANGLQALPDGGGYYEAKSNLVWRPAADGRGHIGTRPPADFTPPPAGTDVPVPPPVTTPPAPETAAVRAFPIFDESTGEGSIILQNLPAPDAGKTWQLWFTDPEISAPFSPGILPPLETGSGRVFFDLGRTGYAPASCFLTQEPAGGSAQPTGPVVLKGP